MIKFYSMIIPILIFICGCSGGYQPDSIALVSVSITPQTSNIQVGSNAQFKAVLLYSDGRTVDSTNTAVWTSSDVGIATVSTTGTVSGISSGNTTVTASFINEKVIGTATITVDPIIQVDPVIPPINVPEQWTDPRGNVAPVLPISDIVCWGDSLTAAQYPGYLSSRFTSPRKVSNYGIGGETSSQILARIKGHDTNTAGITWGSGTIRLKTKRVIPPREISETYRTQWGDFGIRIGEPQKVEFFNTSGLIGSTQLQLKALSTVAGIRFSSSGHPFNNGDEVYYLGFGLPGGMYAGKVYYIRDADPEGYSLSELPGGSAVSFGTGSVMALGAFYFDWEYTNQDHTITTITHTDKDTSTAVIWMGANNIGQTSQVEADIKAAFDHVKTLTKRVLVLTCIGNESAIVGTTNYASQTAVNAWILKEYPNNSVDIYTYLRSKYNPALPQDVIDYNNGITPASLRVDAIHLNSTGYNHVADKVYEFFKTNGW